MKSLTMQSLNNIPFSNNEQNKENNKDHIDNFPIINGLNYTNTFSSNETSKFKNTNYCYILFNDFNKMTYNGFTNNLQRRIRQHNGKIKGGAKYTTKKQLEWKYLAYVTVDDPLFDKKKALSFEFYVKYPTSHRPREKEFNNPEGRLRGLELAKQNPKFKNLQFITYVNENYSYLIEGCNTIVP